MVIGNDTAGVERWLCCGAAALLIVTLGVFAMLAACESRCIPADDTFEEDGPVIRGPVPEPEPSDERSLLREARLA